MCIRKLSALAAVAALGLLALGSVSVSATSLRAGGGLLSGAQTLRNNGSDPVTMTSTAGNIRCNQVFFDADVNATTAATLPGTLTSLTFTSCTDTLLAVTVLDCTLHAGSPLPTIAITVDPATAGVNGRVSIGHTMFRCVLSNAACYYTMASATGNFFNSNSSIDFSASVTAVTPTTDAAPAGNCGSSMSLAWRVTHVVSGAGATVTVTTS